MARQGRFELPNRLSDINGKFLAQLESRAEDAITDWMIGNTQSALELLKEIVGGDK